MRKLLRKMLRAVFDYDPSFCDMYADEPSRRAAEDYLARIRAHLRQQFGDQPLSILDAGCQAGRLVFPLAQDGHRLTGLDASGFALRRGRRHAKELGLDIRFYHDTLANLRRWVKAASVEVVVCTEVLYLCPDYRQLLELLAETVKPGGLLFISHRPVWYYVAAALRRGHMDQALSVLERTEGPSPDGSYHNWQTPEQLHHLYAGLGLRVLASYPVNPVEIEAGQSSLPQPIADALAPMRHNATFRVPSYLLIVAQKAQTSDDRPQTSGTR